MGTYKDMSVPVTKLAELGVAVRALERFDAEVDGPDVHSLEKSVDTEY